MEFGNLGERDFWKTKENNVFIGKKEYSGDIKVKVQNL